LAVGDLEAWRTFTFLPEMAAIDGERFGWGGLVIGKVLPELATGWHGSERLSTKDRRNLRETGRKTIGMPTA
jgi:hypothetical protein